MKPFSIDYQPGEWSAQPQEYTHVEQHIKRHRQIGRLRPRPGHQVFEYNTQTGELRPAEWIIFRAHFAWKLSDVRIEKGILKKEDCIYFSALNLKNARKKLGL